MRNYWRKFKHRFYAGPRFMAIRPVIRTGYQSPTLTAALWIYSWSVRWLTLPGRILLLCTGVLMMYSTMSLRMPIHLLALLLIAVFATDLLVGLLLRPRIRAVRHLPAGVTAGAETTIHYRVTNLGKRPAWSLHIDSLPPPPGVRLRGGVPFVDGLAAGDEVDAEAVVMAQRRGHYMLPAVRCDMSFPFNLWRLGTISGQPQRLLVYPSYTPLTQLALPVGRSHHPGGLTLSSNVADAMEFYGCREYRDGDNPRHIHWRSWARSGRPVVREFRQEFFPRMAVVLDTFNHQHRRFQFTALPAENVQFEAGLSMIAAICHHLERRDYIVDLFAAGPEIYRFQAGRSLGRLEDVLGILATITPHAGEPFDDLSPEIVKEIAQISSAILVLMHWNDIRRELIEQLTSAGVSLKVIYVRRSGGPLPAMAPEVMVIDPLDIRNGRCRSI